MEKNVVILSYESPRLEVIEVEVEKGFAGSPTIEDSTEEPA